MLATRRAQLDVFLRECKHSPADDAPRLILADWLQDQGDPRGELVHLQVHRSRLNEDAPEFDRYRYREMRLLAQHGLRWLGPLADRSSEWVFWRGLVSLEARADRFLVPEVFALAGGEELLWVEELRLTDATTHHLALLIDGGLLPGLAALGLSGNRLTDRAAVALADCPALAGLRELDLSGNRISGPGASALAASPHLDALQSLDVRGNPIDPDGLAELLTRFGNALR
jgi:uncharacterized protein (TIGR02996 family)